MWKNDEIEGSSNSNEFIDNTSKLNWTYNRENFNTDVLETKRNHNNDMEEFLIEKPAADGLMYKDFLNILYRNDGLKKEYSKRSEDPLLRRKRALIFR